MKAWETFTASEEYKNAFQWAARDEHRKGALWVAFLTGFEAASSGEAKSPDGSGS